MNPRTQNDILRIVVDSVDAMLAYWDRDRRCRFANRAYLHWFGRPADEIVGCTMEELLGPELYAQNLPYIDRAYAGETQVFEREIALPDGRRRSSLASYVPDLVGGEVRGLVVHASDVTSLKVLERRLERAKARAEEMATHDYLTGLPNRVMLLDRIASAVSRAKRNGELVAVMTVDLDGFKEVNDTYGHGAGDLLLVEVARRMVAAVRESDTVTRYGGDEFLILAPQVASRHHVEHLAERLLSQVREPFELRGESLQPTFSIGISLYPEHGSGAEELIVRSDQALYAAKRLGKNRFSVST